MTFAKAKVANPAKKKRAKKKAEKRPARAAAKRAAKRTQRSAAAPKKRARKAPARKKTAPSQEKKKMAKKRKKRRSTSAHHAKKSNPRRRRRRRNPGMPDMLKSAGGVLLGGGAGVGAGMAVDALASSQSPKMRGGAIAALGILAGIGVGIFVPTIGAGLGAGMLAVGATRLKDAFSSDTSKTVSVKGQVGPAGGRPQVGGRKGMKGLNDAGGYEYAPMGMGDAELGDVDGLDDDDGMGSVEASLGDVDGLDDDDGMGSVEASLGDVDGLDDDDSLEHLPAPEFAGAVVQSPHRGHGRVIAPTSDEAPERPLMNPTTNSRIRQLAQNPADRAALRDYVKSKQLGALRGQRAIRNYPYYSKVRFTFVTTGAGPWTYTLAKGSQVKAFSYALSENMAPGGFPATYGTANPSDTNIVTKGQTVAGDDVQIIGVQFHLAPTSDAHLARLVFDATNVQLTANGTELNYNLGNLGFMPGGGGLFGAGVSEVLEAPQNAARATGVGVLTNGYPAAMNFMPLPAPVQWTSAGKSDSNLFLTCTVDRTVTVTAAGRAAAAGVSAWTPPSAQDQFGTYVEGHFRLIVRSSSARSANA